MAFYCLTMLSIALELAQENQVYEDLASKFFEHFVRIADSMNNMGGTGLWDATDGFYYDQLKLNGEMIPLRSRSLVGLLPTNSGRSTRGRTNSATPWVLETYGVVHRKPARPSAVDNLVPKLSPS
jgi:hypothetical protein